MQLKIFLFIFIILLPLYAENNDTVSIITPSTNPIVIDINDVKKQTFCKQPRLYKNAKTFANLNTPVETRAFYEEYCKHEKLLPWFDSQLKLTPQAKELFESIKNSYNNGLNPDKYHLQELLKKQEQLSQNNFTTAMQKATLINSINLLLSDGYISLAQDLYYGFTDWDKFKQLKIDDEPIAWERTKKVPLRSARRLYTSLQKNSIKSSLEVLNPDFKEYTRLVKALAHYRSLQKETHQFFIPVGPPIRFNNVDPRLPLIQKRLLESGDLIEITDENATTYNDTALIQAVKRFQERHSMTPDGLIGKKTLQAMNMTIADKITKIILNLERYRWQNSSIDHKQAYINVNIPAYSLQILENESEVLHMNVIVGKKDRPTPILNSKISYAVLNPTWTAPQTIIKEDILEKPNILDYLQKHDMHVYRQINGEMVEQNPYEIDWELYQKEGKSPFKFVAESGKSNPLGVVKFIFPNKYSIYMHDTNSRGLFKSEYRALSSGCIRLGEPKKLLTYLSPKEDRISSEVESEHKVELKNRLPIVIRYMTVGVTPTQKVCFYDDVYGYDEMLLHAINKINFANRGTYY